MSREDVDERKVTASCVEQLYRDCCANGPDCVAWGLDESEEDITDMLQYFHIDLGLVGKARRVLHSLTNRVLTLDMGSHSDRLPAAKVILRQEINLVLQHMALMMQWDNRSCDGAILHLRELIVQLKDLDEVQRACSGSLFLSLEDFAGPGS